MKDHVEVFSWDCGGVATKLNPFKVGFRANTQEAVVGCFKDLGLERRSFGIWKHELEALSTIMLPTFVQHRIMMGMVTTYKKINSSVSTTGYKVTPSDSK